MMKRRKQATTYSFPEVKDKKYQSAVKNKKHKQSHFYHCRGECEYERQGQSETLTERLLLWRGTW